MDVAARGDNWRIVLPAEPRITWISKSSGTVFNIEPVNPMDGAGAPAAATIEKIIDWKGIAIVQMKLRDLPVVCRLETRVPGDKVVVAENQQVSALQRIFSETGTESVDPGTFRSNAPLVLRCDQRLKKGDETQGGGVAGEDGDYVTVFGFERIMRTSDGTRLGFGRPR